MRTLLPRSAARKQGGLALQGNSLPRLKLVAWICSCRRDEVYWTYEWGGINPRRGLSEDLLATLREDFSPPALTGGCPLSLVC